jgi:hydrogenase nickel incorporation protein HypA/HybF
MHEHHAVDSLVKQAIEKAELIGAKSISSVTIVMGEMLGFDEGSVRLYFEEIARGTIAEGAKLNYKPVKTAFTCKACSSEFKKQPGELACPNCCGLQLLVTSGKEWYIDSIEVEAPNP